ncbi:hypothetical protein OO013_05670 [Mangrovivirga sp. M17]|uniref:Uncharacterized protein n=1 Tax=Mangrovivirga halotolerans TaxID=2993936 RepID=A0ABT3RP81_9BACT|nr:hypothetical protein [Mangrovivirga halotolerans]MCX2743343.1 hypothetical protein [Mangrovivirga halotolerans]
MTARKSILIAAAVIVVNLLLGHFFASTGIMMTPVALIIATVLVVLNTKNLRPISMTLTIIGLIIIHDIGLKLYAGGTHDRQGLGWIHLMLIIGLIPSYILLIGGVIRNKKAPLAEKIISIVIFPLILAGHLYLFSDLGLGRHYWYDWN